MMMIVMMVMVMMMVVMIMMTMLPSKHDCPIPRAAILESFLMRSKPLDNDDMSFSCWLPQFSDHEVVMMMATTVSGSIATTNGATNPKVSASLYQYQYKQQQQQEIIMIIVVVVSLPAEFATRPAMTATSPLPKVEQLKVSPSSLPSKPCLWCSHTIHDSNTLNRRLVDTPDDDDDDDGGGGDDNDVDDDGGDDGNGDGNDDDGQGGQPDRKRPNIRVQYSGTNFVKHAAT